MRLRVSLKQKLVIGVALVHAVLMVGFLVDLVERQRSFLSAQSADETQALARALATSSAAAVLANDVMGMAELAGSLGSFSGVDYALLLGRDGRVLAHTDHRLVGQYAIDDLTLALLATGDQPRVLVNDSQRVDAAAPVLAGSRVVAWARVGRSQHLLEEARLRVLREGLTYALLAVAIGTVFAWLLANGVTRELGRLLGATRRVRAGERDISVATDRSDELGDLSRAFGEMTAALRDRERALEESERRWLMALDAAGHGVWDWNVLTDRVFYSHTWKALLGYSDAEISDGLDEWKRRVHPDDLAVGLTALEAHLSGASTHYRSVHRLRAKDASYRWVLNQGMVFERTSQGRAARLVGTCTDITAQRHAEEESDRLHRELDQAHKMEALGQLTGGVAHDFNNILGIIMNNTEEALSQCGDAPWREGLEDSLLASKRACDLVAMMLAYGRRAPRSREAAAPAPPVLEALRMLTASLPSSIELVTTVKPVRDVMVSNIEFQQLVMNLVINARDAVGDHGRIEVVLREVNGQSEECAVCRALIQGEFVELSVTDDGPGISPDVLPRVFDPFFTTKPVGKGTGMGLSVVQGILTSVAGHVQLTSRVGVGTTVRLLIPPTGNARPEAEPAPRPSPRAQSRLRVLIVDDEPLLTRALARGLRSRGHLPTLFTDPRAALRAFEADPDGFDALITDQTMPELSGVELSAKMGALRADLPVFLCTGNTDQVDPESVRRSRILRVFEKPVSAEALCAALEEARTSTTSR